MANFATHLNVAAFVSGSVAVLFHYNGLCSKEEAFLCFFAGSIGGILPDIDHDKSTPVRIMEFFFSNLIAFLVISKYIGKFPVLNLVLIWLLSYLATSVLFVFFKKITKHRGMIHSVPAALLAWFLTSILSYYYFNFDIEKSYLVGFFVFLGYITHLVLDEIFSVDLLGNRIKKSFGSALKICSKNSKINLFFYSALILSFLFLPHKKEFFGIIKGIAKCLI